MADARDAQQLLPFRGYLSPGISFASGHSIWFFKLDENPTRVGPYSEIWMVTPDGRRILYGDPGAAAEVTVTQHEYDEVHACTLSWEWPERSRLHVRMRADDGTEFELDAKLVQTPATRFLNAFLKLAPKSLMVTPPMTHVAKAAVNLLLRLGVNVAGATETGKRFANQADRILLVRDARASLDGRDLGPVAVPPPRPVAWGDVKQAARPFFCFGALYLQVDPSFRA